ncbi:hypothetical protein EG346_02335 [Chryseobacterium carnipullorum]|uniref:Uncharacterized protein n=1 Tax=Chryseobacterium carnipullorum TaxID=1124835 RepID=A0A376EEN5_CHRCU|nr:hypothetical protein [Chryseobacterium carnipullorum]AZA47104.1 hypothetical protein EG346_02335 [Chryseobacterium carnipullorum]AZA66455.1 hypothetical protein EG345_18465 [Chryseobacterium carnipullorum]STD07913.1 Uncharacterised protein [Chryseobacterium carnipullorum]
MKLSDLKTGQKVSINEMLAEYKGIQKVRISNFGKVEKRVFKADGINIYKYYNLAEGTKTLKSEKIELM